MSGGFATNAGGIYASGAVSPATPDVSDRQINLMIYQVVSYMNDKAHGANIQNAARQALGGDPNSSEIQVTHVDSSDPIYSATDIRLNNSINRIYAVGINPNETYFPEKDPNLYYLMEMQDLSIVLTVLQLTDAIFNQTAKQSISDAASVALKTLSSRLEDRAEKHGWQTLSAK
ncbi:MAG TPA: hypothetical protein VFB12_14620 [Ktedonobacteraceae bacterium]|nr:hypothetical protein [Ktedonobacteraceae bacterium]